MPLTTDKTISTAEYWNKIYSGNNNDAKVDASNTKRTSTFDRFQIVADLVQGPNVLEACAGHARIAERVKAAHPDWNVGAFDQSHEAKNISKFRPYYVHSIYQQMYLDKAFDTVIVTQSFEYLEDVPKAMDEIARVSSYLVGTVPNGEMKAWSQLYIFTPDDVRMWLEKYGEIYVFRVYESLILFKIKFHD